MVQDRTIENVNMIYIPFTLCLAWKHLKLNENLFFESLSDYLSLKIKYVFGLIRSWNSKFCKQAPLLLCLTNIACLTICWVDRLVNLILFTYFIAIKHTCANYFGLDKFSPLSPSSYFGTKLNWINRQQISLKSFYFLNFHLSELLYADISWWELFVVALGKKNAYLCFPSY